MVSQIRQQGSRTKPQRWRSEEAEVAGQMDGGEGLGKNTNTKNKSHSEDVIF